MDLCADGGVNKMKIWHAPPTAAYNILLILKRF